jgi:hypothetical protein
VLIFDACSLISRLRVDNHVGIVPFLDTTTAIDPLMATTIAPCWFNGTSISLVRILTCVYRHFRSTSVHRWALFCSPCSATPVVVLPCMRYEFSNTPQMSLLGCMMKASKHSDPTSPRDTKSTEGSRRRCGTFIFDANLLVNRLRLDRTCRIHKTLRYCPG